MSAKKMMQIKVPMKPPTVLPIENTPIFGQLYAPYPSPAPAPKQRARQIQIIQPGVELGMINPNKRVIKIQPMEKVAIVAIDKKQYFPPNCNKADPKRMRAAATTQWLLSTQFQSGGRPQTGHPYGEFIITFGVHSSSLMEPISNLQVVLVAPASQLI